MEARKEGIGLRTIRERAKLFNGQIDTVSTPGQAQVFIYRAIRN